MMDNPDEDDDFVAGWAHYVADEYFLAAFHFLGAAIKGHVEAQYMIGFIQTQLEWTVLKEEDCAKAYGKDVLPVDLAGDEYDELPGNYDAGVKWLRIAANNGHSQAIQELGCLIAENYHKAWNENGHENWSENDNRGDRHGDPVEAYMWLRISGLRNTEGAADNLERLTKYMTDENREIGESFVRVWFEKGIDPQSVDGLQRWLDRTKPR